jgi:hypothetical protein
LTGAPDASGGLAEVRPDIVTIARAPRLWLAKRIWPDRTETYSQARHLDISTVPLDGLDAVASLLGRLIGDPRAAVMRGELIDPARHLGVRRLLYPDRKTGEAPTFRDVPRCWAALDIEGIARPAEVAVTDLVGCTAVAIARLPAAFSTARVVAQATASHGIKPDIRLRLWFWLSRPTSGDELKRWLKGTPSDPAVFSAVAPIYTAAPVFMGGMADPLPCRLAQLPGAAAVTVPPPEALAPPPEPPRSPPGQRRASVRGGARALHRSRGGPGARCTGGTAACHLARRGRVTRRHSGPRRLHGCGGLALAPRCARCAWFACQG